MAKAAMLNGKHVGVECPIAMRLEELWELVDLSERTRRHCMQLENCCYGKNEMRVLRMAHAGLFGDLLHGAGAYNHDLRELMFDPDYYEGPWRRLWHTKLRGDLYPNHGFGPVANYMDVNRGDRAVSITSIGTPALGLAAYRKEHMLTGDPSWKESYIGADRTISLIQTAKGRVIRLEHDVEPAPVLPYQQPRRYPGRLRGLPGADLPEPTNTNHQWDDFKKYAEWDHWLWKEHANPPGGHGGMDYIMIFRLMQCMRLGLVPDFDVYDAAVWTAPVPLSHLSIKAKGAPLPIPDFTRGRGRRPGQDGLGETGRVTAAGSRAARHGTPGRPPPRRKPVAPEGAGSEPCTVWSPRNSEARTGLAHTEPWDVMQIRDLPYSDPGDPDVRSGPASCTGSGATSSADSSSHSAGACSTS